MDICKEVKSRKITVSTGTLAALESDTVQGHLSGTPSSNLTHSNVFLVGLVSLEVTDLILSTYFS